MNCQENLLTSQNGKLENADYDEIRRFAAKIMQSEIACYCAFACVP